MTLPVKLPESEDLTGLEPLGIVHTTAHETNQLAPADVLQLSKIFHESKVGGNFGWHAGRQGVGLGVWLGSVCLGGGWTRHAGRG